MRPRQRESQDSSACDIHRGKRACKRKHLFSARITVHVSHSCLFLPVSCKCVSSISLASSLKNVAHKKSGLQEKTFISRKSSSRRAAKLGVARAMRLSTSQHADSQNPSSFMQERE